MDTLNTLEEVYSEWQNNPEFKEEFKKDPNGALETWGFKLNEKDLQRLLKENEELDKRENK